MPLNPIDFYAFAGRLKSTCGDNEAENRTSVSRAYYAAFHVAKSFVVVTGTTGLIHEQTINQLRTKNYLAVANRLADLRTKRNDADYHLSLSIGQRESGEALKLSKKIIDEITEREKKK